MRIVILIPAFNEAECLPLLLSEAQRPHRSSDVVEVIVVDNGSTDATAEVARAAGARVVVEPLKGYGSACAAGVRAAQSLSAEVIVFLDADRSFDPLEMSRLLEPLRANQADLVIGSRFLSGKQAAMLPHQRFGNWLTARLMRSLYGLPVTDLGPYRAIQASLLRHLDLREMTYGWPTEMMVKAAKRCARIVEVPVSYRARYAGQSKVSGTVRGSLLAAYSILWTALKHAR
jgi:glycosyltransferase involved in cell wall biosynthesis